MRPIFAMAIIVLLVLTWTENVFANGAAGWEVDRTGTPGPIKQNDLILEREHVVFDKKDLSKNEGESLVKARFWIRNPTSKDITVKMGFPVNRKGDMADMSGNWESKELLENFHLKINGKKTPTDSNVFKHGEYRIVHTWEMTFAADSVTQYAVEYPLIESGNQADVIGSSSTFEYITHTGSFWAQPIQKATFEYCSDRLFQRLSPDHKTPAYYWSEPTVQIELILEVRPTPDEFDRKRNCIVWNRENWTPKKDSDDIRVTVKAWDYQQSIIMLGGECGINPCLVSTDMTMKYLCNEFRGCIFFQQGNIEKLTSGFDMGSRLSLSDRKLSNQVFDEIRNSVYDSLHLSHNNEEGLLDDPEYKISRLPAYKHYDEAPDHLKFLFEVHLLRYMRNYIAAQHGHEFEDPQLKKCFEGIPRKTEVSDVERHNLTFILQREKIVKEENEKAWKKIGLEIPE